MVTQIGRIGQNHINKMYVRYFWQGSHQIDGRIQFWPTLIYGSGQPFQIGHSRGPSLLSPSSSCEEKQSTVSNDSEAVHQEQCGQTCRAVPKSLLIFIC